MIAVIGDIHGCYNTLRDLVSKVRGSYPKIQIFLVGDLIDRGNFSCEVMDFVRKEKLVFTPGNHDYMFFYFVRFPSSEMGRAWVYNGFEKTIASYNDRFDKIDEHIGMIQGAPLFINTDDCFISHAGISKYYLSVFPAEIENNIDYLNEKLSADIEKSHGILWTRDSLMNIGKLQIVGHTRQAEPRFDDNSRTLYIDTSVYTGNKLSAAVIEKGEVLEIFSVPTYPEDLQ